MTDTSQHSEGASNDSEYAAVDAIERNTLIPGGTAGAFHGYGVIGLPFRSGHVLSLLLRASSLGPAYTSIWHRDPADRWTFYSTVPPDCSCARYFGARVHRNVITPINLEWTTPWALRVRWRGAGVAGDALFVADD
jgi:hypothetical protein